MNIYDDYFNYIKEYEPLIEKINSTNSNVLYCISDVLKVMDIIYQSYLDKKDIDNDTADIFEVGFGYLSNVLYDLNTYYNDYFQSNMDIFNYYSELILYSIYLDDYISYLDGEEVLSKEELDNLHEVLNKIDDVLRKKLPCDSKLINGFEDETNHIAPLDDDFKPVYIVFSMIWEQLDS